MLRVALTTCFLALAAAAAAAATPDAVTPDGGRYSGPLKDGKLHGRGRIEWDNKNFYEGDFAHGLMAGHGHLQFSNGVYEGDFREGASWGVGEIQYDNGRKYRGEFVRNDWQGKGRLETPEGEIYEGDFSNNEFTGTGSYLRKDGARYDGEFRNWVFHGHGRYSDGHGSVYQGTFVNSQLEGPGKATSPAGSYEGEFKGWMFHGHGVLKLANGDVYEGSFANGSYDGQGTLTYAKSKPDGRRQDTGVWRYGMLPNDEERARTRANVETALYSQRQLLDQALASLKPRQPDRINLYLLAIAGDGSQEVFRREVEFVEREFADRFGTAGRTVGLINSRNTVALAPMATTKYCAGTMPGLRTPWSSPEWTKAAPPGSITVVLPEMVTASVPCIIRKSSSCACRWGGCGELPGASVVSWTSRWSFECVVPSRMAREALAPF